MIITNNWDLMEVTDIAKNSKGGTETAMGRLYDGQVPRELLEQFQIIPTRVRELNMDKFRILWIHDLPGDPEVEHLKNEGWKKFHMIVFVSNWQAQQFIGTYNIPWSKCCVLTNAIYPIEKSSIDREDDGKVRLIYHTTPHRGLNILLPVFNELAKNNENLHLDVFSSFKIYGWGERDDQYKELFKFAEDHPQISYFGDVPDHSVVREHLSNSDIFAYPSIWPECGACSLMEAMSAGLCCVHSSYGGLYEGAAGWTLMYNYNENLQDHARMFLMVLQQAIEMCKTPEMIARRQSQRIYANSFYNWDIRAKQWENLLQSIIQSNPPKDFPKEQFTYKF